MLPTPSPALQPKKDEVFELDQGIVVLRRWFWTVWMALLGVP